MSIEIKLVGFGDDRPARFGNRDRIEIDIDTPATPDAVLEALGIDDTTGLVLMNADSVIPARQWQQTVVTARDRLTILAAIAFFRAAPA